MGLFGKKETGCQMCGLTEAQGCGSMGRHVVEIRGEEPAWLPPHYRAQAQGEYTFLCTRCHAFPASKWPGDGGAGAAMEIHLGAAHHVGKFAQVGSRMNPEAMIPVG
jgi:hypothetical protein